MAGIEETSTISETLRRATARLRESGTADPQLAAQSLLAAALGCDRTYLIVNFRQPLDENQLARYGALVRRRAAGEPLQYITGHQEFFGLEFEVTPDVLIPRPETELLVEEVVRLASSPAAFDGCAPLIIDVGTGSGCLAVTLARELPGARVIASDISPAAILIAHRNARRHGLAERIDFVIADLLEAFAPLPRADFIVSNPPYVAAHELPMLQREVREWEPHVALTDGADGLSFYRRLLNEAATRLRPGGYLICELGYTQSEAVADLVDDSRWAAPRLIDDLAGIPRAIVLCHRGNQI
jgi:release factor glutamine methyltransferase